MTRQALDCKGYLLLWSAALALVSAAWAGNAPKPPVEPPARPARAALAESRKRPELVAQTGHSGQIEHLAISRDSRLALTGGRDHTALLWDLTTGLELRRLVGHTEWVTSVAFSPDGKRALTGSEDHTARLWDLETGRELCRLKAGAAKEEWITVAFSPDGRRALTGSWDGTARLWNLASGKELGRFSGHDGSIYSVAFSRDGTEALAGTEDYLQVWDLGSGKRRWRLDSGGRVESFAVSPDGRSVLTAGDRITLWTLANGKELREFHDISESNQTGSVALSPDGRQCLNAGFDGIYRAWDAATGKLLHRITIDKMGDLWPAEIAPDGESILTGSGDIARLWDPVSGKELLRLEGDTAPVLSLAISHDGKSLLAGSDDGKARLWDLTSGSGQQRLDAAGDEGSVESVAFKPDGKSALTGVSGLRAGAVGVWDLITGRESARLAMDGAPDVFGIAVSSDGKQALIASGNDARLWDLASKRELRKLRGHKDTVLAVAISPDGTRALTGCADGAAGLWDLASGREIRKLSGHSHWVISVAFSRDGNTALTGSFDGTARLWDLATGREIRRFTAAAGPPDRGPLTAEIMHGGKAMRLAGPSVSITAAAFSPDGTQILTGGDDHLARLWNPSTGRETRRLAGHSDRLMGAAFSPDGKEVFTGSMDGTVRVWRTETGQWLCTLIGFADGSWAVVDSRGRYDASDGGNVDGLHWVVGLESIELKQLKQRYYDPGLLAKYVGFNKEPLRSVAAFDHVDLPPDAVPRSIPGGSARLTLDVSNQGGGIGRIQVFVNGREVAADARGEHLSATAARGTVTVDLSSAAVIPGRKNQVRVVAWNAGGYLSNRGAELEWVPQGSELKAQPQLYALVAGVSDYAGADLHLQFAAKDARDFATALRLGADRLFGAEHVFVTLLNTPRAEAAAPTKERIRQAFLSFRKTKPEDVLVVYLAGHGVTLRQGSDTYCYLTADARAADPAALADPAVREATTVTNEELFQWLKAIPALKQVVVLDTCAAGAAVAKLTAKRAVAGDQIRAAELLKDRTGCWVLMGCAADRVSYEASEYGQGLLTYALLQGLQGPGLRNGPEGSAAGLAYVDSLFGYAQREVETLAGSIGGVQRPVLAVPWAAQSFPIGELGEAERKGILLAKARPRVLRPVLINRVKLRDDLGLGALLRKKLQEAAGTARGAAPLYVDAEPDELPGAVLPSGEYTVDGKTVRVTLVLANGEREVSRLAVDGTTDDLEGLATALAKEIDRVVGTAGGG